MAHHDNDDLTEKLRAADTQPPPSVPPPVQEIWDTANAKRTSRHRRRIAVTSVAAVALAVIAIPTVNALTSGPRPPEITTTGISENQGSTPPSQAPTQELLPVVTTTITAPTAVNPSVVDSPAAPVASSTTTVLAGPGLSPSPETTNSVGGELYVPEDSVPPDPGADAIRAHDAALKAHGVTPRAYVTDPLSGQVLIFVTDLTPEMEAAARDVLGAGNWVLVNNTGCIPELGC